MNEGGSLEQPAHVIKNAVELAPVDIKFDSQGKKLAATSMDNSLKIFDLKNEESLTSNLVLDSNTTESGQTLDPWRVCFNPKNSA